MKIERAFGSVTPVVALLAEVVKSSFFGMVLEQSSKSSRSMLYVKATILSVFGVLLLEPPLAFF